MKLQVLSCSYCRRDGVNYGCSDCKTARYCSIDCMNSDDTHISTCNPKDYIIRCQISAVSDPPIWRELTVPALATFGKLHQALCCAFSWHPYYSAEFKLQRETHSYPKPMERTISPKLRFGHVFENIHQDGEAILWLYDVYSLLSPKVPWTVNIKVIGRSDMSSKDFKCYDGGGHAAAQGIGPQGWERLKAAYKSAHPSARARRSMKWYERCCGNGDEGGLGYGNAERWDREGVNWELGRLPKVRKAPS